MLCLVFPYHAKRLARGTSPKWPILCRVGCKTTTQSMRKWCILMWHWLSFLVCTIPKIWQSLVCWENVQLSRILRLNVIRLQTKFLCCMLYISWSNPGCDETGWTQGMPRQAPDTACEVPEPRSSGGGHWSVVTHEWDYWTATPAAHCKVATDLVFLTCCYELQKWWSCTVSFVQ